MKNEPESPHRPDSNKEKDVKILTSAITINNAGLVLANSYIKILFSRLNLILENSFVNGAAQMNAIHILDYLSTGIENTDEMHLSLNKLLCGIHPTTKMSYEFQIKPENTEIVDGLIESMIRHWPAIGATSNEGFRGNWLARNGILIEYEDNWSLTIEKKAYDLLLKKSPFSFSVIKLPWMNKPLTVTWPY